MKQFTQWYLDNVTRISWFFVGFFIAGALNSFGQGNIIDAGFCLLLACANYYVNKK